MKRALLSQILHEWKENFWMVVELAIVTAVIWCLATNLTHSIITMVQNPGYDTTDVYAAEIQRIDKESSAYIDTGNDSLAYARDLRAIVERLRSLPYVEAVGLGNNALPYNLNFTGNAILSADPADSVMFRANTRMMTPDMATVLRLMPYDKGADPARLHDLLAAGEGLLGYSREYDDRFGRDFKNLIGRPVRNTMGDTIQGRTFGACIVNMKRHRFEEQPAGTMVEPVDENSPQIDNCWELAVRVRPGEGYRLEQDLSNRGDLTSQRNLMLINFQPMNSVRANVERSSLNNFRVQVGGVIFLLFIVYMGLLGTFWFRVQTRTPEIALRKVCGATSPQIFRRLLSEGMILQGMATVIAAAICVALIIWQSELVDMLMQFIPRWEIIVLAGSAGAFALMTIIIVLGIWMPARRALRIRPADALKEE